MNHKKELLHLFKSFHEILEKENLWYVAEFGTLLGAIREGKMIEWDDDIDLLITWDTYLKLKEKFPENILDTDTKGYPFLFAKWISNKHNFLKTNIFIDLFILVPSSERKLKNYMKERNIYRFSNQMFNKGSKYKPDDAIGKILKIIQWPFQWTTKKIKLEDAYNMVLEKDNPEFNLVLNLPIHPKKDILTMKRSLNSWNRKKVKFHDDLEIYIPENYDEFLKMSYGPNYMTPIKTKNARIHIDAINSKKLIK